MNRCIFYVYCIEKCANEIKRLEKTPDEFFILDKTNFNDWVNWSDKHNHFLRTLEKWLEIDKHLS